MQPPTNATWRPKLRRPARSCAVHEPQFGLCSSPACQGDWRAALCGLATAAAAGCRAGPVARVWDAEGLQKGGCKSWKSGAAQREQSGNSVGSRCMEQHAWQCGGTVQVSNSWGTFVAGQGAGRPSTCRSGGPRSPPAAARLREDGGEHGADGALAGAGHQLHHAGLAKQAPNLHGRLVAQRGGQPARKGQVSGTAAFSGGSPARI